MKKIFIIAMVSIFSLTVFINPVFAGSKQHYRWEGFAIGVSAAILGSALINSCQPDRVTVVKHETYYYPAPPRHCEHRRIWVPPVYDKVWNPGHYENVRWVSGEYIMIERSPGYWTEDRYCGNNR